MSTIDRSIEMGRHITDNIKIKDKTWDDFFYEAQKRKIILFGISEILNFLWLRCNSNLDIVAAIDNEAEKQGHYLNEFFDTNDLKDSETVLISSKEILNNYSPNEVVILISSLRYYEEIAAELEKENYCCYFSILNLEYNYRKDMKLKNVPFETQDTFCRNYAIKCVEKETIKNNKVVFFKMSTYKDHGKYITKQLLMMNNDIDIVWFVDVESLDIPSGVRKVNEKNWRKFIYEVETAKIWIVNDTVPTFLIKRQEQLYIQVKHWGSITLKRLHLDMPFLSNVEERRKTFEINGKWMDYVISGSELDEDTCRKAFNFKGKYLRFGSPRSDILFLQEQCKKKIYNHFNLNTDDHILLYAPTFRMINAKIGDFRGTFSNVLDFEILLSSLKQKFGKTWKILLRLHPSVKNKAKQIKMPNYVIDVSKYDDGQELIAASDILISDYSSIMFEPAYILKPVFLYAPDKDDYIKNEREFLIDYNSLPFPISTTNEELSKQIMNFDEAKYKQEVKEFLDKYGVHEDGHASERTAKFIVELIGE
ncbi:MAG: CDP-glycerol glycerophosphotransferase family protein [Selenomonadaceae bacterium]|nr:CDP-glycerol glycerophosphotransferase family protein [Selenomonadaceae bacterium]